jgi:hypothetical protein
MDKNYMNAVKNGKYCGKIRETQPHHTTHNACETPRNTARNAKMIRTNRKNDGNAAEKCNSTTAHIRPTSIRSVKHGKQSETRQTKQSELLRNPAL